MKLQVQIVGTIEVDDDEAEILHHLCCYDLIKYFVAKCSNRFTEEQITERISKLRHRFEAIRKCKKEVEDFLATNKTHQATARVPGIRVLDPETRSRIQDPK